jgi:hypothetical protein
LERSGLVRLRRKSRCSGAAGKFINEMQSLVKWPRNFMSKALFHDLLTEPEEYAIERN